MKCDNCGKREATVHLTEIKDGVKNEQHLCEHCAAEKGLPGKTHFSISELLAGLASAQQAKGKRVKDIQCPSCELTLSQFQAAGRLGCPECYTAFKDEIMPLVEKVHDGTQHVGKVPARAAPGVALAREIRVLQTELKRVVKKEDYERAAALRDQVQRLEEQLKGLGSARAQTVQPGPEAAGPHEKPAGGGTGA